MKRQDITDIYALFMVLLILGIMGFGYWHMETYGSGEFEPTTWIPYQLGR